MARSLIICVFNNRDINLEEYAKTINFNFSNNIKNVNDGNYIIEYTIKKIPLEKNNINKLILIGSILLIIFQVIIHIGVNIRLLPTTGMTLPFLSYGGSSILSSSILAGLILNFTKRNI